MSDGLIQGMKGNNKKFHGWCKRCHAFCILKWKE